jgi:hypothetical protein
MIQETPKVPRAGYPVSPCNDICTLDEVNVCIGCRRTLDEIVGWSAMSAAEQWTIVRSLPARSG